MFLYHQYLCYKIHNNKIIMSHDTVYILSQSGILLKQGITTDFNILQISFTSHDLSYSCISFLISHFHFPIHLSPYFPVLVTSVSAVLH